MERDAAAPPGEGDAAGRQRVRRALLLSSGANRGAWYAGFPKPLLDAGLSFEILAGVSAGGIASAWFAAGDPERYVDSWREADDVRVAPHPWLAGGRRFPVDELLQRITLRMMDLEAARTAEAEVRLLAARLPSDGRRGPLEPHVFTNREARDGEHLGRMLRATAFVPWINGFRAALELGGERYLDGGLVHRVPLWLVPRDRVDEIWIAVCSPNARKELERELAEADRPERLVVLRPSRPLPVGRWTTAWAKIGEAIALGREDMEGLIARELGRAR